MKKFIILGAVVATAFLSSCKKDYTCACKFGSFEYNTTIKNTKSKAKTTCEAYNSTYAAYGQGSCTLK